MYIMFDIVDTPFLKLWNKAHNADPDCYKNIDALNTTFSTLMQTPLMVRSITKLKFKPLLHTLDSGTGTTY